VSNVYSGFKAKMKAISQYMDLMNLEHWEDLEEIFDFAKQKGLHIVVLTKKAFVLEFAQLVAEGRMDLEEFFYLGDASSQIRLDKSWLGLEGMRWVWWDFLKDATRGNLYIVDRLSQKIFADAHPEAWQELQRASREGDVKVIAL